MKQKIKITKGLDISVAGQPKQTIDKGGAVRHVAVLGPDYIGLKPRLLVDVGQTVSLGEPLFHDKRDSGILIVSPGTGRVVAVNRARRRKLQSVVIELDETATSETTFGLQRSPDAGAVRNLLVRSGLWAAFRTRPYNRIPDSTSVPRAIFVTAIDTRPLSADPQIVITRREQEFRNGMAVLCRLGEWPVYLCTGPGWSTPNFEDGAVRHAEFAGPHPAGLPGTHIHCLQPAACDRIVWHIGYQDVIAIGHLFQSGRLSTERIVAIGGPGALRPRLVSTRLGACVVDLLEGEIAKHPDCTVLSGSVLDGMMATGALGYIGRYHNQISVVPDVAERRPLGWFAARSRRFEASQTLSASENSRPVSITTASNGRQVAMIPVEAFERVMPLDILPSPLLRALLVKDTDAAQSLGCLELAEEDLALTSFVCPAKQDYGAVLRLNLDRIERDG